MMSPPVISEAVATKLAAYPKNDVFDGCTAAAHAAYACTDTAFIYPITPSTPMAEIYEVWAAGKRLNVFGNVPQVMQLQSEAGAAGAVHGALSTGAISTTFTASQGLLLMIPPMYKIAGELMPCVFHVAARAIAGQALSIFGDHSDVMAVRQTGWALLGSTTVQESQDLGVIAHMATLRAKVPFVHFFDGFRTSHELQKIDILDYATIRSMLDYEAVQNFRSRSLNPTHPHLKGTAQGPEVYFQNVETANKYYQQCHTFVIEAMNKFAEVTGRKYKLFEYFGAADATDVIVIMGSGAPICREAITYMLSDACTALHKKVGVLIVRLFRPWSLDHFLAELPETVQRICVLDRVKEPGALGEPLFLDVAASIQSNPRFQKCVCVGGRYGLGSRDFTPAMVLSVFENLMAPSPVHGFSVGINDDVTHMSLDYFKYIKLDCVPKGTTQCMFWGMGSDGTVGANKNVIKILGMNTPLQVQGYFAYSAHKAGGLTVSHLRFGPEEITSSYLLQASDYIAVHRPAYLKKYNCFETIKENATAVINCDYTDEQLKAELSGRIKRQLASNNVRLFAIDANKVAAENGMGRRINNVLMTSFFKVSGVLPFEQAIALFKTAIQKTYGKKGMHVVEANWKCVDAAVDATREVIYDRNEWLNAADCPMVTQLDATKKMPEPPAFVSNVMVALARGEDLPVSAFAPFEGGVLPPGTAGYEKRAIALNVPTVDMDKCTQCNQCSFVCPHAAIRPFLLDETESEGAPKDFVSRKCKAPASLAQYKYRIQVSPLDCTGCELCFIACPDNALTMEPLDKVSAVETENWKFAQMLAEKSDEVELDTRLTLKGSQFFTPMMEFSGACEGCGETPYVKLLTQLFGERLVIANATGCSSIWGASYPANAYTVNQKGFGPAWGNSLFEDNAEYGYGMAIATATRRRTLKNTVTNLLSDESVVALISTELRDHLAKWLLNWTDAHVCQKTFEAVKDMLTVERSKHQLVADVDNNKDLLPKISQWIVGGDGWAYDIGFGGLDHVVASGVDVNILVMDTEVYSNTGGQTSKATPIGAVHKFAAGGKLRNKKDLGSICMEYGDVYVASISSSANMTQTVRAFVEAESYEGVSVIMAYAPCIEHQYLKPFNLQLEHCKLAVNSGFWPLYRYDPRRLEQSEPAFQLDSKKIKADVIDMVRKENRFAILKRADANLAADLEIKLKQWVEARFERYVQRSLGNRVQSTDPEVPPELMWTIIFGTDTGNAEGLANRIGDSFTSRGLGAKVMPMDELTLEDAAACMNLIVVVSTAGQGEFPPNAKAFGDALCGCDNQNMFENTRYAVMGLGDTGYVFFNQAAKRIDLGLARLGGKRLIDVGLGDDQHEDGYEGAFSEWLPELLTEIKAPEVLNATDDPLPTNYVLEDVTEAEVKPIAHDGFKLIRVAENRRVTPEDYEVDIRHLEFDLADSGIRYALGDSLALMPQNSEETVKVFCDYFGFNMDRMVKVKAVRRDVPRKYASVFANPISVRQLFCEVLDIFGKPPRNFYEHLFRFATNDAERAELKTLMTPEKKPVLKEWVQQETVTFFDVMKKFPSVKLSIEQMIDLIPMLKPRYYSIASSQRYVGANNLHLCIGVVDWKTCKNELRFGELTGFIRHSPKLMNATVKPTAFNLPPTDMHPIIVAGMGTGLSPFRSFIQYRALLKDQGKEVGPLSVYFGCRYKAKDYLYQSELEHFHSTGVITELELAFSRDQAEKDYIQHHIVRNSKNFYQRMVTEDGYFYLCGSAKQVPIDVRKAVRTVLTMEGGMSEEQAEETITQWQLKGKYNVEAW